MFIDLTLNGDDDANTAHKDEAEADTSTNEAEADTSINEADAEDEADVKKISRKRRYPQYDTQYPDELSEAETETDVDVDAETDAEEEEEEETKKKQKKEGCEYDTITVRTFLLDNRYESAEKISVDISGGGENSLSIDLYRLRSESR
jgi:Mg-chelatase subunit ChlI